MYVQNPNIDVRIAECEIPKVVTLWVKTGNNLKSFGL